ncbi:MAG TPA: DUF2304 domain-containing protein [Actinomycetota bacterium]|nr:DUF2304 domain-containing protein [Actinomycetota bacterium]
MTWLWLFKLFAIAVLAVVARLFLSQARSVLRDRLIVLALLTGLVAAVLFPESTSWVATKLGIGRGVDLAFYVAFLLLFFVVAALNARRRDLERSVTVLTREVSMLKARPSESGNEQL